MIPADVATRLRPAVTDQPPPPQPVTPAAKVGDVLSNLAPGQRLLAEIQALLPNGSYRAVVAQREITLSLPFSAKAGDSLELEVVDSDGQLTLAFVANRHAEEQARPPPSVSTRLSSTGQLIGDLLGEIDEGGKKAKPAALNGNQPLTASFPESAAELVPVLKNAITRSGLFYESHQANWLQGRLPTEALLREPQGQHSAQLANPRAFASFTLLATANAPLQQIPAAAPGLLPSALTMPGSPQATPAPGAAESPLPVSDLPEVAREKAPPTPTGAQNSASSPETTRATRQETPIAVTLRPEASTAPVPPGANRVIAPDLTPLVQQQLDALATQNYVWQGQIWPGQEMHWEIQDEDHKRPKTGDQEEASAWQTRLVLQLPRLGGIDAQLRIAADGQIDIRILTDQAGSEMTLQQEKSALQRQFAEAGLNLASLAIHHADERS